MSTFRATTLTLTIALASVALSQTALAAPPAKGGGDVTIGYVNVQRAILEVEEGKRAKNQLKVTFEEKQKKLTEREAELKKLKDTIDKELAGKNDEATNKKKAEFQNKLLELQQVFMKEQQDLQAAEQKQLSVITDKMRGVIKDIGEAGAYTIILEIQDSRLLYAKPHLDLTNEVIRKYNAKFK